MDFASVSTWINVIGFITVGSVGTICNAVFLYSLLFSKNIRHALGTSVILVGVRALNDFVACSVAIPLRMWSIFGPAIPPAGSLLCTIWPRLYFSLTHTSMWLTCVLAACRLLAVYAPHFYRKRASRPTVMIGLALFAMLVGWATTIVGSLAHWYVVRPNSSGICIVNPVSRTLEAISTYNMFIQLETFKGTWIPLPLGMVFYALVYARLHWNRRRRHLVAGQHQQQSIAMLPLNSGKSAGGLGNVAAPTGTISRRAAAQSDAATLPANGETKPKLVVANTAPSSNKIPTDNMLSKVRLLFAANVVDLILMLPQQLMFALGLYLSGSKDPWILASLAIMYASASASNLWVYVLMSKPIRAEYRRVFWGKPT